MARRLRLQNADLLTEYKLMECDLARPTMKAADFHGKAAHPKFREREHQPATLCTLVMTGNIDSIGVARYLLGKNIALAYLPHAHCEVGRELQIQYFADVYPVRVAAVGYKSLYEPENGKPRS